jgi:hypothetical protein
MAQQQTTHHKQQTIFPDTMRTMRFADDFLRRSRRRWMIWRIAESAGSGAALAACVGLLIVPILVWRDQPAIFPAIILLSVGTLAGIIRALIHPPTLLRTAIEIDRQFQLHDLLSTVLRLDASSDDAFAATVIAHAEKTCAQLSPNQLIVQRLGLRGWGGIGIASALLLTLASFSVHPRAGDAQTAEQPTNIYTATAADTSSNAIATAQSQHDSVSQRNFDQPGDSTVGDDSTAGRNAIDSPPTANHAASGDGAGSAAGKSADAKKSPLNSFTPHDEPAATSDTSGQPAGGGVAAKVATVGDPISSGTTIPGSISSIPPAWHSEILSADRAAAAQDVQTGQIPDADRDLVRDYFDLLHKPSR